MNALILFLAIGAQGVYIFPPDSKEYAEAYYETNPANFDEALMAYHISVSSNPGEPQAETIRRMHEYYNRHYPVEPAPKWTVNRTPRMQDTLFLRLMQWGGLAVCVLLGCLVLFAVLNDRFNWVDVPDDCEETGLISMEDTSEDISVDKSVRAEKANH